MPEKVEDPVDAGPEARSETVLARKLKKTLDLKLENDKDTLDALQELSTFFHDNNLKRRRNLRGEIERRNLQINSDFLAAFKVVKESLDEIHGNVKEMSDSCKAMQARLAQSKAQTQELMVKTNELQSESSKLTMEKELGEKMRERLSLTNQELMELRGGNEKHRIGEQFFIVLEKVIRIQSDCKVLVTAGHDVTGNSVMDRMEEYKDTALDRLYRWAQSAVRNIELGENTSFLAKGFHFLQSKEVYFNYVIDEYISSRRQHVVRQFLDALTVGGPGGTPRPIEMHAHDPTRYVGDMLAWLHQICPGEAENISQLLKLCQLTDVTRTSERILSGVTEGVCRPLKTRIEQILVSETSPIVLYKLTNLIRFYESTITSVLKCPNGLSSSLLEVQQLSYSQFLSLLQGSVSSQLAREGRGEGVVDLSPSSSTSSLLGLLRDVLAGHSVVDSSQADLPVIVRAVVDPLSNHLQDRAQRLSKQDAAVFLLNNYNPLRSTLSLYQGNESGLTEVNKRMEVCLKDLSKEQFLFMLASLELSPILTIISQNEGGPLSSVPGTHREAIFNSAARLDNLLAAPDLYLLPVIRMLVSSQHRKAIRVAACSEILESYKVLYKAVTDPKNEYEAGLLSKTPDQVQLLMQL